MLLTIAKLLIHRMFFSASWYRKGSARAILRGLETGYRQLSAITLYEKLGFKRFPPFGKYMNDALSFYFEETAKASKL